MNSKKKSIRKTFAYAGTEYPYELYIGGVKRLNLRIRPDGSIRLSVPRAATQVQIDAFLAHYANRIAQVVARNQSRKRTASDTHSEDEAARKAKLFDIIRECHQNLVLPRMLELELTDAQRRFIMSPTAIRIHPMKTRWGSCSAEGNLNFNCLLMLTPREVLDSVIVHELCHRKHMNHSREFYREVRRVFPEYDKWHGWLRENGGALMRRVVIKEEA